MYIRLLSWSLYLWFYSLALSSSFVLDARSQLLRTRRECCEVHESTQGKKKLEISRRVRLSKYLELSSLSHVDAAAEEEEEEKQLRISLQKDLKNDITNEQIDQLWQLRDLVVEWNERINLVSRKNCTAQTVWERHILPSIAAASHHFSPNSTFPDGGGQVIDVGTGGGFPGLPLAILFPNVQFTLLDSVGKKLVAVQDMAHRLKLRNVHIHHGRAEDYFGSLQNSAHPKFDLVLGRSVTALDQFCLWIDKFLKPQTGQLLYWIGGPVDSNILSQVTADLPLPQLLPSNHLSPLALDKRILILPQSAVGHIAQEKKLTLDRSSRPHNTLASTPQQQEHQQHMRNSGAFQTTRQGHHTSSTRGGWKNRPPRKDDSSEVNNSKKKPLPNPPPSFKRYSSSSKSSQSFSI